MRAPRATRSTNRLARLNIPVVDLAASQLIPRTPRSRFHRAALLSDGENLADRRNIPPLREPERALARGVRSAVIQRSEWRGRDVVGSAPSCPGRALRPRLSVAVVLAIAIAACPPGLSAQRRTLPAIWGVWMGLGGVADADPRFRNTPFPADPDFTQWGAEESRRLASHGGSTLTVAAIRRTTSCFPRFSVTRSAFGPTAHLVVLLGGEAGLRCGEMIGLEWGDVDLVKRQMCIQRSEWRGHVTSPKGGRLRYVPMTSRLASALQGHRHLKSERPSFRPAVHIDCATRSCSHLAIRGAPARAIQELAGHQDLMTTQRYMHLSPALVENAI